MTSHQLFGFTFRACVFLILFFENVVCFAPSLFPTMSMIPSWRPSLRALYKNQRVSWSAPAYSRPAILPQTCVKMKDQDGERMVKNQDAEPSRKPTSLEAAASLDLDQAESDMKLANIKDELQDINKKMMATLRRRKTLLKKYRALNQAKAEYEDFVGTINTFCTAEEFDMPHAFRRLRVWSRGNAKFMEEGKVLHVRTGSRFDQDSGESTYEGEGDAFIFPYGVVVCWGLDEEQELELLTVLRFCEVQGYVEPEEDHFSYTYGEGFDYVFSEDQLILTTRPSKRTEDLERSVLEKLAASHGFAQSSRLAAFAESVQQSIEDTRGLAAELAAKGDIVSQSQRDIARTYGRLILDRHTIYLYADVLDTPDVCWENPDLDPLYRLVNKYLELSPRVELLNSRVDVVRELLSLLSDELQNKHASRLEEIIIFLITVEILIEVVKDIVPMATSWVQKNAAISAVGVAPSLVASSAVQAIMITTITCFGVLLTGAVFTGLYWWWTVFR
ncbi:hypothetical protein GUITHDRAFT_160493 [Guillardia theta CCMP2712]|uniref:DUF155 domain-containing protein n=2 Tax=Geminigeraceae TaxID=589343 RepID=L1K282_GUITC|nr:hypothetical protein GUITHDRAFT_160493 [Guillardia theta CCMP2712]EKX54689.1 hypothetical protein GUITHDRAFT_160493 [Guillardia theta CCMP2712]|eukprot:XP_005841669.1 hypothetical protein GUITHDRAFT_160493 [Guillardia theta CCMP2712]